VQAGHLFLLPATLYFSTIGAFSTAVQAQVLPAQRRKRRPGVKNDPRAGVIWVWSQLPITQEQKQNSTSHSEWKSDKNQFEFPSFPSFLFLFYPPSIWIYRSCFHPTHHYFPHHQYHAMRLRCSPGKESCSRLHWIAPKQKRCITSIWCELPGLVPDSRTQRLVCNISTANACIMVQAPSRSPWFSITLPGQIRAIPTNRQYSTTRPQPTPRHLAANFIASGKLNFISLIPMPYHSRLGPITPHHLLLLLLLLGHGLWWRRLNHLSRCRHAASRRPACLLVGEILEPMHSLAIYCVTDKSLGLRIIPGMLQRILRTNSHFRPQL